MFNYLKVALYLALFAAGSAFSYFVIAVPKLASFEKTIAQSALAAATERQQFMAQAAQITKEKQDEADIAAARIVAARIESDKRNADLRAESSRLRGVIAAYAVGPYALRLPATAQAGAGTDDRAVTVGGLLSDCLDLSAARANDAERLADQLRGLQALAQ